MIGVKQVKAKKRSVWADWCTVCNQWVRGNGSVVTPYRCGCGAYGYDWSESRYVHPTEVAK